MDARRCRSTMHCSTQHPQGVTCSGISYRGVHCSRLHRAFSGRASSAVNTPTGASSMEHLQQPRSLFHPSLRRSAAPSRPQCDSLKPNAPASLSPSASQETEDEGSDGKEPQLWTPADAEAASAGAARLLALMSALPELSSEGHEGVLAQLIAAKPELVSQSEPAQVRATLEGLSEALGVPLLRAAVFAGRVPAVWDCPPTVVAGRVMGLAKELGVGVEAALDFVGVQPGIWAVRQPSIIKDRLDCLATRLGLPLPATVALVVRQPLLWVVPPVHVVSSVGDVAAKLGLGRGGVGSSAAAAEAEELVVRCPPVLAVEGRLMRLSVQGLSATSGVPVARLLELLGRSLGLVTVPTELLATSLEGLAGDLGCRPEDVVRLLAYQPTLLCAQYGTIQAALEMLEAGLGLDRSTALAVLIAQPTLMYDTTANTIASRVEALASTFGLTAASGDDDTPNGAAAVAGRLSAARQLAASAPALLAVAPATVRSAASMVAAAGVGDGSRAAVLEAARSNPGEFVMAALQDSLLSAWSSRLALPPDAVRQLLEAQPALLELTPTTVKARLESLSALFGAPLPAVCQLVLRHSALLAVPPNATITRAKNVSTALRVSMQTAASLIAKEPALLGVLAHCAVEARACGLADAVAEVGAVTEYYTLEWLQRQLREMQPARVTSFAGLDSQQL